MPVHFCYRAYVFMFTSRILRKHFSQSIKQLDNSSYNLMKVLITNLIQFAGRDGVGEATENWSANSYRGKKRMNPCIT